MKNKLKIVFFFNINEGRKNSGYFEGVFNETVIPLSLVGYALIIANSVLHSSLAIYKIILYPMHTRGKIVKHRMDSRAVNSPE